MMLRCLLSDVNDVFIKKENEKENITNDHSYNIHISLTHVMLWSHAHFL